MQRIIFLAVLFFSGFPSVSWADDCGVRGNDGGTKILKFDCEPVGTNPASPLQVHTPSGVRGIRLVDPTAAAASKFRVRYTDTSVSPSVDRIKAIGFIPPGISSCEELQMIGWHPSYPANGNYILATDIDCSATNPANPAHAASFWGMGYAVRFGPNGFDGVPSSGDENLFLYGAGPGSNGFKSISNFNGKLDGTGKIISNLYSRNGAGLFGNVSSSGQIMNIGLKNVDIIGAYDIGVGGLANIFSGVLTNAYVSGSVTSRGAGVGGLIGGGGLDCVISNSYSAGTVTSSSGTVASSGYSVGGLAGGVTRCTVSNCYSTANVSGGLSLVGGLIGQPIMATISNSYATGRVNSTGHNVGGLVGSWGSSTITNSYWNSETSGVLVGTGQAGDPVIPSKTTAQMVNGAGNQSDFSTWTFAPTANAPWKLDTISAPARTKYPCLSWQDDATCPGT